MPEELRMELTDDDLLRIDKIKRRYGYNITTEVIRFLVVCAFENLKMEESIAYDKLHDRDEWGS